MFILKYLITNGQTVLNRQTSEFEEIVYKPYSSCKMSYFKTPLYNNNILFYIIKYKINSSHRGKGGREHGGKINVKADAKDMIGVRN